MNIKSIKSTYFNVIIKNNLPIFIFALVGLIAILNHSMWRDELQAWMIARDSHSLAELYKNFIPEGHPILWFLMLFAVKSIINQPIAMQLLHWSLGCFSIILFWHFSPFKRLHKTLFIFGSYPFYEYFIISRNYVLILVFSFLFCSFYPLRRKTYIPAAICIGLLANSHAYAFFMAISFCLILIIEWLLYPEQRIRYCQKNWKFDLILSLLVVIALVAFSAYTMILSGGSISNYLSRIDLRNIFIVLGRTLGSYTLLIPNSKRWLDLFICGGLSLGFITSIILFLRRFPLALLFYLSSSLSLAAFNYFIYLGDGSRHYGVYYVILVVAMWLTNFSEDNLNPPSKSLSFLPKFYPRIFTLLLVIQLVTGLYLFTAHLFLPFSASKATVQYIKTHNLQNEFIVASPQVKMTPIAGYLNKPLYYPEISEMGTFTKWDKLTTISKKEIFKKVASLLTKGYDNQLFQRVLLIVNYPLEESSNNVVNENFGLNVEPIAKFKKSWQGEERYYLYWARK